MVRGSSPVSEPVRRNVGLDRLGCRHSGSGDPPRTAENETRRLGKGAAVEQGTHLLQPVRGGAGRLGEADTDIPDRVRVQMPFPCGQQPRPCSERPGTKEIHRTATTDWKPGPT